MKQNVKKINEISMEIYLEKEYFCNNIIEDKELWQDILKYRVKYNERERGNKQTNCDTLREIALKVLVSEGQVDWKTIYLVYPFTKKEQWCVPIAIDLLISNDNYQFSREVIPDYIEFCENWWFCGKLKIMNKWCKNCCEIF